ncbi:class I SAM-dependent rRNA methyltransferase [Rhabdothermincola salaria]|uniref:class I SAM-dependent rRNA methyltransferase n=1 Tax=Rhabdothermincola salaria TaxID=2903142 RepID=UPI001E578BFC|nr:class I SAM-dependent rRNA methyltransferase [Rhabdothermincola salaria]MCD9624261.1 class I SAM-dependent rRNA methyltransferase [Rhabdothermincola salaria]
MSDVLDRLPRPNERRLAVRVNDDARRHVRRGHPWVFEASITSTGGEGQMGDLAVVFDRQRRFQAIGLYDPDSPIRVRVLHHGEPETITPQWWHRRLADAIERRAPLLASPDTSGLRLVHGENDGFPGLVVDRYDSVLVIKLYSAAWLPHLRTVVDALVDLMGPEAVVLRLSRALQRRDLAGLTDGTTLVGAPPAAPVPFREHGLVLEADVVAGQKTGYFLDQRDNRQLVRSMAGGARVLDVFSCTGGFSLAAAAGGATSVTSVDVSHAAIQAARRNLERNRDQPAVARCRHETITGDAFEVMARLVDQGARFDLVVVDPPSFAQRQSSVPGALRAYGRLTDLAVRLVAEGGVLVQASCSARVSAEAFFGAVRGAAAAAGVGLDELARTGHPLDHPIGFDEGAYLKAIVAGVQQRS